MPATDPRTIFGNHVRTLRLERNLSQEKLAELADLHRNDVGGVERGERNIALVNILRLARALRVKPGSFSILFRFQGPQFRNLVSSAPTLPKSPVPTAFFSSRYQQTDINRLFNTFNHRKCLRHIFATNPLSEAPIQTPNLFCLLKYCRHFTPSLPPILLRTALDLLSYSVV